MKQGRGLVHFSVEKPSTSVDANRKHVPVPFRHHKKNHKKGTFYFYLEAPSIDR